MHALVFAAGVLLGAIPALAADGASPLPAAATVHMPYPPLKMRAIGPLPPEPDAYLPVRLDSGGARAGDPLKTSTVTIGPLSARLGGTSRRADLARYRLEGMAVLGGSVSGTLDTRGARIYLRWPPGDDE